MIPDEKFIASKMVVGTCPHCNNTIVEIYNLDSSGKLQSEVYRKQKAIKELERQTPNIIGDYIGQLKQSTKSNMGFRYGLNQEIHDRNGNVIQMRQYAVDFNGTKYLINTK